MTGRYPCSQDEAVEFAALQLQITFGDHNPQSHHAGFFEYELRPIHVAFSDLRRILISLLSSSDL